MIKKAILIPAFICCVGLLTYGQQMDNPVVLTVENYNTTLEEFKNVFFKNNNDKDVTKAELDKYMKLFIEFRLKIVAGKENGLDTLPTFKREMAVYRKQLAKPYMVNQDIAEKLVREAYNRLKTELKLKHIMVALPACPKPKDTLSAYMAIKKIKKEIDKKNNFEEAAKQYSQDTYSSPNGGLIGYYKGMMLAYPFENAAYALKVGEVSGIVRTKSGYHLIKLADKRKAKGKVQVAQIFVYKSENEDKKNSQAWKKINEAYVKLQNGMEWGRAVRLYSQDYATVRQNGLLKPFGINTMEKSFEKAAFALTEKGEYTKPIETSVGYHIIKLDSKILIDSFETEKNRINAQLQKLDRWSLTKKGIYKKVKSNFNFSKNEVFWNQLKETASKNDNNLINNRVLSSLANDWVFKLDGKTYKLSELLRFGKRLLKQDTAISICEFKDRIYNLYLNQLLLELENKNLLDNYPEFKALMQEYSSGIILFNMMNKEVWQKSILDSTGLQTYYKKHQDEYTWKEHVKGYVVKSDNKNTLKIAKKLGEKVIADKITQAEFLSTLKDTSGKDLVISYNVFEKDDNKYVSEFWQKGISQVYNNKDGKKLLVIILGKYPPQNKTLEEARGAVISDYQVYLEKQWMANLKDKYQVKVNKTALYSIAENY